MLDTILKLFALVGFAVTLAVLAFYVPAIDLQIVLAIVFALSVFDFLIRPWWVRRSAQNARRGSARPGRDK